MKTGILKFQLLLYPEVHTVIGFLATIVLILFYLSSTLISGKMDLFYLLGVLVFLISVSFTIFLVLSDCDPSTFLCVHFGKQPETEFRGKVIWITGASSGIGEAIAKHLAKIGAKVVLSARRKEELERVKQECLRSSQSNENDILVLPLDVTNFESHEPSLKNVLNHFGRLDVLLSNAGQGQNSMGFVEADIQMDRRIFELNMFSMVNMNRLVVKYFLKNGGGQIAIISSFVGRAPIPLASAYVASKRALHGYFDSLRIEMSGKKVNVTVICPGAVDTTFLEKGIPRDGGEVTSCKLPRVFFVMSTDRCAYLSLVSIANRMNESWISKLPFLQWSYISIFLPLMSDLLLKVCGGRLVKYLEEEIKRNNLR